MVFSFRAVLSVWSPSAGLVRCVWGGVNTETSLLSTRDPPIFSPSLHHFKMSSSAPAAAAKPPNVLVYQADRDASSKCFLRARECLEVCLTPERYVVYPLGADEISHYTPWKENCRLLLVPPPPTTSKQSCDPVAMAPRVVEEILSYVQAGGKLLSMGAELNSSLGLTSVSEALERSKVDSEEDLVSMYCPDGVCDVELASDGMELEQGCKFSSLVPELDQTRPPVDDMYLSGLCLNKSILSSTDVAHLVPVEWNADMEWIQTNTNHSNNKHQSLDTPTGSTPQGSCDLPRVPCVREVCFAGDGRALLSSVDLLPSVPPELGVAPLVRLKRGVALRERYLTLLLRRLGLECSEEQLPQLTHTYLLCAPEVEMR